MTIDIPETIKNLHEIIAYFEAQLPPPPPDPDPEPVPVHTGIWIGAEEIAKLPMEGAAWDNVLAAAQQETSNPNIANQNDMTDVYTLAKALVHARAGEGRYLDEVANTLFWAMLTETGAGILAVARNLLGYILAADIINLKETHPDFDENFRDWLSNIRHVVFDGAGPSLSIIQCHEQRPNNFGTHAGAARIAIALYLGDTAELERAAAVFHGWLGNRDSYVGFKFGDLDWQVNPLNPVGVNPMGAMIDGHDVDGVLPDDQRRGGGFTWPPPRENYVFEALQGAVVQAQLLTRAGYPAWDWCDTALLRAANWLHTHPVDSDGNAGYPAEGDDRWITWLVNAAYGSFFPVVTPTSPGKSMGFTDWTHGPLQGGLK